MPTPIVIRPEAPEDYDAITVVIDRAFEGKPYAAGDESDLVVKLRDLGDLVASLVAVHEGEVVGQICFSRAELEGQFDGWYALGPIAVLPVFQGRGIGAALMNEGLRRIADLGAQGSILLGDPRYYSRFGFQLSAANCPENLPAQYFMIKQFSGSAPHGRFSFHPAFGC